MIVEIKNFGPIESFTFDLNKDLHFIIGENGVGKSYASYCLYCVLKHLNQWAWVRNDVIEDQLNKSAEDISLHLTGNSETEINNYINESIKIHLTNVFLPNLSNSLLNTFSSFNNLHNRYLNDNFLITIKSNTLTVTFGINENNNDLEIKSISSRFVFKIAKKSKTRVYFELSIDGKAKEEFHKKMLSAKILYWVKTLLKHPDPFGVVKEVIFLPSSRSGLYQALNAFSAILAELSQKRFLLKNRTISLPALSEPVSDYFISISTLNKKSINKNLVPIITELEQSIIKGTVEYDDVANRIIYQPNEMNIKLDLSESSSMVSELSTIVLVLKHVIEDDRLFPLAKQNSDRKFHRKTLLFIEEPEAHLHPEVQIKLMKIFTDLIGHEIKLVITSHSDYMFNQLNNMILDHKVDPKRIGIYHLINTPKGSIVNPEVQATKEGMMDENFSKSAEKLFEERIEILERQNSAV